MATFYYKASNDSGDVVEGEMQAADQAQVVRALHDRGYVPIRAERTRSAAGRKTSLLRRSDMKLEELREFTHDLATLLNARLPLDRALGIISTSSENARLSHFAEALLDRVKKGSNLADACEAEGPQLPHTYATMIRAGEASGMLDEVLQEMAENLRATAAMRTTIIGAIRYPLFVLVVALLTIALVFTYVVPEFKNLFDGAGAEIPASSRFIFAVSDFFVAFGWLVLLLLLLGILALARFYRSDAGRNLYDGWALRSPIVGPLIRKRETIRLAGTMAMLLEGGASLIEAIDIVTTAVGNRVMAAELDGLAGGVRRGDGLAASLAATGSMPDRAIQLIRVGEESGRLVLMLREVVRGFEVELKRDLDNYLSLVGPVLTIGLGLVVAGTIGAIMTAILGTYNLAL